ncbi:MAG: NAD(P)H-dependent oxidoreductase [Betaproteobacteria bacterium]
MKPDDGNGRLPTAERPYRVLIISGSDRRQYNCPGVDSKSRALMLRMAERLPQEWEIDYEDLGNVFARSRIQSCNACASTAMPLCVWPCNCYEKNNKDEPDLMWDLDLYARLDLADAWAILGPVNWYAPTSNLKLMFDRLVCMNGGNPQEALIEHKNPEMAQKLEHEERWKALALNHMEGRTAGFFCYGDDATEERNPDGRPRYIAPEHAHYFDPAQEPEDQRETYAPLVWQCRFSGIEVPEPLWHYQSFGSGRIYSENQAEQMATDTIFLDAFDAWSDKFAAFVRDKGKVEPGKYRAFDYQVPSHRWTGVKLWWRDRKMRIGQAPEGSSPKRQEELGMNQDVTLTPSKSEGEKIRSA